MGAGSKFPKMNLSAEEVAGGEQAGGAGRHEDRGRGEAGHRARTAAPLAANIRRENGDQNDSFRSSEADHLRGGAAGVMCCCDNIRVLPVKCHVLLFFRLHRGQHGLRPVLSREQGENAREGR